MASNLVRKKQIEIEDAIVASGEVRLLANELNSALLMSDSDHSRITSVRIALNDQEMAGEIVKILKNKFSTNQGNFEKFMTILNSNPAFEDILGVFQTAVQQMQSEEAATKKKLEEEMICLEQSKSEEAAEGKKLEKEVTCVICLEQSMCEEGDTVEKSIKKLEEEVTCAICHEKYNEPKALPCCHYYCKKCIYKLANDMPFSCPECRMYITLPQGGVDNFPTAFFVNRLKDMHTMLLRTHGKVNATCEMCSGVEVNSFCQVNSFCRQCAMFICEDCVMSHRKLIVFTGHNVVSIDELKEGGGKEIIIQKCPLQICEEHDETKKLYCFDCSCFICRDCTMKKHEGHNYDFIKDVALEEKSQLIKELKSLKKINLSLLHTVKEIQSLQDELITQADSVANKIKMSFEHFRKIIEQYEQELLKEAEATVTQKLDHLSGQEKILSVKYAVSQSVIDLTEQYLEHSTDEEIIKIHADIESRIHKEIEEYHNESGSLEPVEELDVGVEVNCSEDLMQLFRTKAKITKIPIECCVKAKGVITAEINKLSELSLITRMADGRNPTCKHPIDCYLETIANDFIVKCNIDPVESNENRIQYIPTVRGQHKLVVTSDGQEVAGSPFPMFVSIPPTQLGKPVRIIRDLIDPVFVTVNSVGEIIVTENIGNVNLFDKEGQKIKTLNYNANDPTGVAVDENNNIYLTNSRSHSIMKFSNAMEFLKETIVKEDSQLSGVAVVGDEVMVCDAANNCVIVYTKELEYVREFISSVDESLDGGKIYDIASDEHGDIYVSDAGNSLIQVFANDGKFLRTISTVGPGINDRVCVPIGLCVVGQYVYVTDFVNYNISVYTTMGEYVTTFGKMGSNEGEFINPYGVCTDKDGYIYVCDIENSRIQIF